MEDMRYAFTAAVERALAEAAAWTCDPASDRLEAPAVLLGLLTETECRAAIALARSGVDPAAVLRRWPGLARSEARYPAWGQAPAAKPPLADGTPVRRFAPDLETSLSEAARRFRIFGPSVELATEHVLLGLAAVDHEVSEWLLCQGVEPDAIEADIRRLSGDEVTRATSLPPIPLEESPTGNRFNGPEGEAPAEPCEDVDSAGSRAARQEPRPPGAAGNPPSTQCSALPHDRVHALRIVDAAANRGREGLRVVEDFVRFVLDDVHLTRLLKSLRHDMTAALGRFSSSERLAARETQADVGTRVETAAERSRGDSAEVLAANFARLQESLRSLEEFAKVLDREASAPFEQLRYRSYTLQRAVEMTRTGLQRLGHARLYVLIDGCATLDAFCRLAGGLVASGVHAIQLRDKRLEDRRLIERARALREITAAAGVLFIMNDRPDLAVVAQADGVHVGQEELSVKDARTVVGPERIVGVSTHSIQQARQAVLDGASYLGVGPTFPSGTKDFTEFPGIALVRAVAQEIRLPAFAIGGITLGNLPQVLQAGLFRVAVSGAIARSADPAAAARAFLGVLGNR
jgi:thiamine-phosphate pyrophosphorylase